ncbi:MAG: 3-keto-5-aminohexanoate cleavage protein [Desulfarculaceae bacterium]
MSSEKVVVTVSVTGGIGSGDTPNLPITPKQIADSTIEARQAGASVAHIHVRDPKTGDQSMDFKFYKEVFDRIRDRSDILINLTLGPGARVIPDNNDPVGLGPGTTLCHPQKRVEHVVRLKPELCSLDVGSMDFGRHVFVNYSEHIEWMAEQIKEAGVKPEMEAFSLGHIAIGKHLIETERVKEPAIFQLCLGVPGGIPATPLNMIAMKQALPANAIWAGFGIGASCFPMVAQAVILGGNVRAGMEDNLYLAKGVRAKSNAELIERAVTIIRLLGKEPATPEEARKILQLD